MGVSYHPIFDARILVHGDDFVVWAIQNHNGTLGCSFGRSIACVSTVLWDLVRSSWCSTIVSLNESTGTALYEADPRHLDQMLRALERENCKAVKTPSKKQPAAEAQTKLEAPTV